MNKLQRLKSFDEYKHNDTKPKISENKEHKEHKSVVTKQRMLKESAFKVGDDYKVKVTFDVPLSLMTAYIEKVQSETGKNALEFFSESELAEQLGQYILKQHLNIDQLPTAIAVGETSTNDTATSTEEEADSNELDVEFGDTTSDEPEVEATEPEAEPSNNIDVNDSDLSIDKEDEGEDIPLEDDTTEQTEETGEDIPLDDTEDEDKDENGLDLNSDEVNLGEEREVSKTEENEEEYEEFDIDSNDDTDVDTSVSNKSIDEMKHYLKYSGIDCYECTNKEVVDFYNQITSTYTVGIDEEGNVVEPTDSNSI